jgi:hypothetical protein
MNRTLLALLIGIGLHAWPALANAFVHTVCVSLRTSHMDAATGDHLTAAVEPARGVKISSPVIGTRYTMTASGCAVGIVSGSPVVGPVTVYAESRVGTLNNIYVRSFATVGARNTWQNTPTDANLAKWVVNTGTLCGVDGSCVTSVVNTNVNSNVSDLHAAAVWSAHNIDIHSPAHLAGNQELFAHNSGCSDGGGGSCMESNTLAIQTLNSGARRKFLIGHEVGHWWHQKWGGSFGGSYFISNPSGAACDSVGIPGDHALRSLEYQKAAYIEGFAHYLSALAFNDHASQSASFQYYKIFIPTDYDNDVVNVEIGPTGGATNAWTNECGCPGCDSGVANVDATDLGTELDWLRAFWDFRTDPPANTQPTHSDVFDIVATSVGHTSAFAELSEEVPVGLVARWNAAASLNGIDHGDPAP